MKPARSILDASFRYVPSMSTSVTETWCRFGWRPPTLADRERPQSAASPPTVDLAGTLRTRRVV